MKDLNNLIITNVEANTESGFFFVEFENGQSLQCCLMQAEQSTDELAREGAKYLEQIQGDNSGFDEGISADCNDWAVIDNDGNEEWDHILDFIIEQARKNGVQIVS